MAEIAEDRKESKIVGKPNIPGKLSYTEFVFDKGTGVKLNTNMFEYKKPTILDIGPCETVLVETRSENAVYGSTGIRHAMATTQLVVCAVANAIGKWLSPALTPNKILRALGKA